MKTGQLRHENPQRDCITLDRTRGRLKPSESDQIKLFGELMGGAATPLPSVNWQRAQL